MERKITCIICPRGCTMTAREINGTLAVTGNTCPRGEGYATTECTNPVRTVTSTVRVSNRKDMMVSVKTEQPVPKEKMMDVMSLLRSIIVSAPVKIGDVIISDVFGARVVATKDID